MKLRVWAMLGLAVVGAARLAAAGPPDAGLGLTRGRPMVSSLTVTFEARGAGSPGELLVCRARIGPAVPGGAPEPAEPVMAVGRDGICSLQLPYAFAADGTLLLSYEVVATRGGLGQRFEGRDVRVNVGSGAEVRVVLPGR